MDQRKVTVAHEDDIVLIFDATQDARHGAMLRLNEMARAMVERSRANAAGQQPDEDGVVPGPGRLRLVLGFDREDKSAKQRKFLHGPVLGQIAEQVRLPDGSRYTAEVWKHYFRKLFVPDRWESYRLPGAKRATPHRVRVSTESLSVRQYSALIDAVIAHATSELGVVFDLDPAERESVRYVKPKRAATQPALQTEVPA